MALNDAELTDVQEPEIQEGEPEPVASSTKATMKAAEALEKLRRGETLENVRIERLRFRGEFTQPVKMMCVDLIQPTFEGAMFRAEVSFTRCTLDRPRFFRKNDFAQNLSFNESTLIKARLEGISVGGGLYCSHLCSRGKLTFAKSRFNGRVVFWEAHFRGWVEFKDCEFLQEADFRSFHADEGFVLYGCKFEGDALFRGATVSKKLDAGTSRFAGMLDFSKAKLHDFVYLETIEQGDKQQFAFLNTLSTRILVRTEQLTGRLASETRGDYCQAMHEYGFLKRAFEGLHRYEQEDWAYYCFKVNQRRSTPRSWLRPWSKLAEFTNWLLLDQGCGYCTDLFKAVRTALIIMLGFGLIYMVGIEYFHIDKGKVPFTTQEPTSFANRVILGLLTSVSVFTSGLGGIRDVAKEWMNIFLVAESLLGTILWGLFIVAFSRKVIR